MSQPALPRHRHCMVVHNYYPVGEPRVQRQTEALVSNGSAVDIICLRHPDEPAVEINGPIRIFRLPVYRDKKRGLAGQLLEYLAFFALAFFKLSQLYFPHRYQVIQIHNLPDFLVFTAILPRLMGTPVILDIHDLMPEFYASRFKSDLNSWPVRLIRLQEWLSCRFANRVITVSELWRQTLIQRGVSPTKCFVVMNVADDNIFKRTQPSLRQNNSFHLLYHGTLTYRYGIDLALRALAQVRSEVPNIELTIHGRGEYLSALEKLVDELDLQDNVHFSTSLISIKELPNLLLSADVGLVPYRRDIFTDGILPTKLMEYAALGLPAIVARTPVIETYFNSDMVEFFEAGNVEALSRCILRLKHDSARRMTIAQNIGSFNYQHNWVNQRANYLAQIAMLTSKEMLKKSVVTE